MKKTATITFHRAINYGAVLQAYALQHSIIKFGIKNEIINYKCKTIDDWYKLIDLKSLKLFAKSLIMLKSRYCKRKKFNNFIKKNIYLTDNASKDLLVSNDFNNKYDFFITGSDQVWNYEITNFDGVYFLDFVRNSNKMKSYAASLGMSDIPEALKNKYKNYLERFSTIMVREKTGAELIGDLIDKKIDVVLDPVLLLNKNEWNKLTFKTKFDNMKNEYILVYMSNLEIKRFAEELSLKYKLKVFNIADLIFKKKNQIGETEAQLGPEEFISAIKNAKFVVTASFHAMAFSIIFNKEFFININEEAKSKSSRLIDLLSLLEIDNREIKNCKVDDFKLLNWEKINEKLDKEKNISIKKLKQMLDIE